MRVEGRARGRRRELHVIRRKRAVGALAFKRAQRQQGHADGQQLRGAGVADAGAATAQVGL
jgi:hypothetical protein